MGFADVTVVMIIGPRLQPRPFLTFRCGLGPVFFKGEAPGKRNKTDRIDNWLRIRFPLSRYLPSI